MNKLKKKSCMKICLISFYIFKYSKIFWSKLFILSDYITLNIKLTTNLKFLF